MKVVKISDYRKKKQPAVEEDLSFMPLCPKCESRRLLSFGTIKGQSGAVCPACGDVSREWLMQLINR